MNQSASRMKMDKNKKQVFKHKGAHLQEEPRTPHSFHTPSLSASKDEAKERKMWWKTHSNFNFKYLIKANTDARLLLWVLTLQIQQLRHALEILGNSS